MSFRSDYGSHIRIAKAGGRLHERVQHDWQIECRAADDLEHVGGGGLLLQRFTQLVEQPRVLDGDDGLLGEIAHQLDLLVAEGPHLSTVDGDGPSYLVVLEHRDAEQGAHVGALHRDTRQRIVAFEIGRLRPHVGDVDRPAGLCDAGEWDIRGRPVQRPLAPMLRHQRSLERRDAERIAFAQPQDAVGRLAKPGCVRQHRLEHRVQLARRTGNDLQHFGGRGLLRQRLGELGRARLDLVKQAHVLDCDHRLVGKGRDQLDLTLGEWAYLVATDGMQPSASSPRNRGTDSTVRWPKRSAISRAFRKLVSRGSEVVDVDSSPIDDRPSGRPGPRDWQFDEVDRDRAVMSTDTRVNRPHGRVSLHRMHRTAVPPIRPAC